MEQNHLPNIRELCDGMQGHNFRLPDCLKFIAEKRGDFDNLNFWDFAALTGDTVAPVYNHNLSTYCEYCLSGYLAGKEYLTYVFNSLGYDTFYAYAEEIRKNPNFYAEKIAANINRGTPVLVKTNLTHFFTNPKYFKTDVLTYGIVTGYEENGAKIKILVYGHTEYCYTLDSETRLDLIFVGEKKREKTSADIFLTSLKKAPYWLTLPEIRGMCFGGDAYRRWAEDIVNVRFTDENLHEDWWSNYGVYVCNLATSGSRTITSLCEKLAASETKYEFLKSIGKEINSLLPSETLTGGRSRLWIDLEAADAGMDMKKVKKTMSDSKKRDKAAEILINYADRLDKATDILCSLSEKLN